MKTFLGAMAALIIIIIGIRFYSSALSDSVGKMEDYTDRIVKTAKNEEWENCRHIFNDFKDHWSKKGKWITGFIHHDDIHYIDESIAELMVYIDYKDAELTISKAETIKVRLRQMPSGEELNLENLF